MSNAIDHAFMDWKSKAAQADLLSEAVKLGAKLKRSGAEWVGPCPRCGGRDRFSINTQKNIFNCRRGEKSGDVISLVQYLAGVDFLGACEILTGEPPPRGQGRQWSDQEKAEYAERQRQNEERQRQREAEDANRRARRSATAREIWEGREALVGSVAESYLHARGIPTPPMGWPGTIAFSPSLVYELDPAPWEYKPRFPCLIACVQDIGGKAVAVHRVYLDGKTGKKIDREESKLTIGAPVGGAVRIGGLKATIIACEGAETGLAIRWLTGFRYPVWCTLGTSGLAGLEIPPDVERVIIYPDGDRPIKKKDDEYIVEDKGPPGRVAANKLKARCDEIGVECVVAAEPGMGTDYLDVWVGIKTEEFIKEVTAQWRERTKLTLVA